MPFHYLLFYKPFRVLSQFTGDGSKRTLAGFISVPGVYPVGRLDYDSEGLLLLTDDGAAQHRLADPRFEHPRTYWVQVEGEVDEKALTRLSGRLKIQDYRTKPCLARKIAEPELPPRDPPIRFRRDIPTSWIELTLTEGRNRQVRRMTAAVGYPTLRLVRSAIGKLRLDGLAPGTWRTVLPNELAL